VKRTRAQALVLVNWSGVFYERYLLDRHVTALEGSNGAGKTTVLIAAYLCLLPDLGKLRFVALGESGPSGGDKGIYGRLGEHGRPSYAALDLRLASGERVVAGVHLERRTEPTVELQTFVVQGLGEDVALQDVFLRREGDIDAVPELADLRERAALAGGRLKLFPSAKDYFAMLFEAGVTPLRLAAEDERVKLNEMLRTSMVGGISRALTGGMRDFLLREDHGLADTLKLMRANLDACRRTRGEVGEARALEAEISQVFEHGQRMFTAAVLSTRDREEELRARVEAARAELEAAERRARDAAAVFAGHEAQQVVVAGQLEASRSRASDADAWRGRVRDACVVRRSIDELEPVLASRADAVAQALAERRVAEAALRSAEGRRDQAELDLAAAAHGLADARRGVEDLMRRAGLHRSVVEARAAAAQALGLDPPDPAGVTDMRAKCEAERDARAAEVAALEGELATFEARRRAFEAVLGAVGRILGAIVAPHECARAARLAQERLRELDALASDLRELPARIVAAERAASEQAHARTSAEALASSETKLTTESDVRVAHANADVACDAHESAERQAIADARLASAAESEGRADTDRSRALAVRWRAVREAAASLTSNANISVEHPDELVRARAQLREERDRLLPHRQHVAAELRVLQAEASRLEALGGCVPDELLRARDAVDGELLASRFENIEIERAGDLEARLGPLASAVLVQDATAAARLLISEPRRPDTVLLVDARLLDAIGLDGDRRGERVDDTVIVPEAAAVRVTRIPADPVLGREARRRRAEALRDEAGAHDEELARVADRLRVVDRMLVLVDEALPDAALLDIGDPELACAAAEGAAAAAASRRFEAEALARAEAEAAARARARRRALAALLPRAYLLEAEDHAASAGELRLRLSAATRAARDVASVAAERTLLVEHWAEAVVDPPREEDRRELSERRNGIVRRRDVLSGSLERLRFVEQHREAFEWTDAEEALAHEEGLTDALGRALREAETVATNSRAAVQERDARVREATEAYSSADSEHRAVTASLGRERTRLAQLEVQDASDAALAQAERELEDTVLAVRQGEEEQQRLAVQAALAGRDRDEAARAESESRDRLVSEEKAWKPAEERWAKLRERADAAGVLGRALTDKARVEVGQSGSINLNLVASESARALVPALERARDGVQAAAAVRERLERAESLAGETYLDAWLVARAWLQRRVPPQVAETGDPLEALQRVREHLAGLGERLTAQERNLRGQSGDVARSIDVQLRKARRQVSKLSAELADVRFGSIRGVAIEVRTVEKMERILEALRTGAAQQLLFHADLPLEEAMEELFRQYGGGRTGGHKLLDYREYLDLRVMVRRQSSEQWEQASPAKVSTGEAIGVGAAVMMVVLTAWERDSNLLRPRSHGTLRFLFLDEANRLSADNLSVLFEMCQNLDLQLVIAAPEVARTENNTTYRLVRTVDEGGREVVHVSGRRTVAGASA
jgi:chromosome partition protein MukB